MAEKTQTTSMSLEEWDEKVRELLSNEDLPVQLMMQQTYFDVVSASGFDPEVQAVLRELDVYMIRQNNGPVPAHAKESVSTFWSQAQVQTTQTLQRFLTEYGIPANISELYSVAEIANYFPGSSSCSKKCSDGDFRSCCC